MNEEETVCRVLVPLSHASVCMFLYVMIQMINESFYIHTIHFQNITVTFLCVCSETVHHHGEGHAAAQRRLRDAEGDWTRSFWRGETSSSSSEHKWRKINRKSSIKGRK